MQFVFQMKTFIYVYCLFFSLQPYTVDSTISLLVLLSVQHIHNGTTQWGNLGYHSLPFHRTTPDYKCSNVAHLDHRSSQLGYWNQTPVLLLFAETVLVPVQMKKNTTTERMKRMMMRTADLRICCCFCFFCHFVNLCLMNLMFVLT